MKTIKLIELFAGIGSQAKALERLGYPFEHHVVCEIDKFAVKSYNAIHGTDFEPMDITKLKGRDLAITDRDKFTYLLTPSHVRTYLMLVFKKGCLKGQEQGQVFCGKWKGCSTSVRKSHRYCSWKMCLLS